MIRRYALHALLLLLMTAPSQAQWQWGNPLPQGNDLWNVDFTAGGTGWAVGAAGMILKSSTAGSDWVVQTVLQEDFLRGVAAVDALTAWVAGDNGIVLKTTDGGSTWTQQNSGTTLGINNLFAVTTSQAVFVGDAGMLRTTTDGGATWIARSTTTTNNLNAVCFATPLIGVAVGSNKTIVRSTDGGVTWSSRVVSGMNFHLLDVFFVDAQYGWACGSGGTMLATTDAGDTWTPRTSGTIEDLNKVRFADRQYGSTAGESGVFRLTTNGGTVWIPVGTGTVNGLEGLDFTGTAVIAVGLYGDILQAIGTTISMITTGPRTTFNAVSAASQSTAWAVGEGGSIAASTDGGASWQGLSSGTLNPLFAVDNVAGLTVAACGGSGVIRRSTDGGQTWSTVSAGTTASLNGIDLLDGGRGYIVGDGGVMLKSTNFGASWSVMSSPTTQDLACVHFADPDHGTAVGANGTVLSTTNGGNSWTLQQSWTLDALFSVLRDGQTGMICGDAGTVLVTTNGGADWDTVLPGTTVALFDLIHPAPGEYSVAGADGVIMRTTDFGQTWVREISHASNTFYGMDANGGTAFLVGEYGMALRNASYPVPVELRSFTADISDGCVRLAWESEREDGLYGYDVQRDDGTGWSAVGFVPAHGSAASTRYAWSDCMTGGPAADRQYRLKMIDYDGSVEYGPALRVSAEGAAAAPGTFDAYPSPALSGVHLRYALPEAPVELRVHDASGRLTLRREINGTGVSGVVLLSAETFPATGVYIATLRAPHSSHTARIVVTR
jgi:photosystem II stability/assembly factor-like uncharacterized protein